VCVHERECSAWSRCPQCVCGVVRAHAGEGSTGGMGGGCGLGDGGGASGSPLARQEPLACCRCLSLQRAHSGRHKREGEGVVR
jgi:hypothetical protein